MTNDLTTAAPRVPSRPGPLHYELRDVDGRRLLAADPPGGPRIVEALGEVATADHIAVLVPGNGHDQQSYLHDDGPESVRAHGERVLRTMRDLAPGSEVAVVIWVGYRTPSGLVTAASSRPARDGAADLARLTRFLPRSAHLSLVGHSYGSTVAGLALAAPDVEPRVDECVALGSPGMGVRRREELGARTRLWAAQGPSDWIRFFPRATVGHLGLGRAPLHPALGATRFSAGDIVGHSEYYAEGSESLRNIARIAVGLHDDVTRAGADGLAAAGSARTGRRFAETVPA